MVDLINADCMDLMSTFKNKQFDLAIVDPPYGLDLANMNMGIGKTKKASKAKNRKWVAKDWDKNTPTEAFFVELWRVSKNRIIWGGNYFDLPPCKHYVIWDKKIPNGLSFADCEFAWTSFDKAPRIFRYSAYLDKQSKFHPTQKPVILYKWLLDRYAEKGWKILDTHLGSGNIAIACHDLGYDLTGIELDKEYYDAAVKNYNQYKAQLQIW